MIEIEELELNNDGDLKKEMKDHTLYKMPDYKNTQSFNCIKNQRKLDLLRSRCMNLDIYPVKMVKLLLDGDYNNELKNYKSNVVQFINELLEKKIPYTRLGVQTKLYKLITAVKNGRNPVLERKTNKKGQKQEKEIEQDEDEEEINDIETLTKVVVDYAKNGKTEKAINLVNDYLEPYDPLYHELMVMLT